MNVFLFLEGRRINFSVTRYYIETSVIAKHLLVRSDKSAFIFTHLRLKKQLIVFRSYQA